MARAKVVSFARCGTMEQWERHKNEYPGVYNVMPATIYVSDAGLCLVTSQEWVDWLTGKREEAPVME